MALADDRFKSIEARCSEFGAHFLYQVQNDPRLPALLTKLEATTGTIFWVDIEAAYREVVDEL